MNVLKKVSRDRSGRADEAVVRPGRSRIWKRSQPSQPQRQTSRSQSAPGNATQVLKDESGKPLYLIDALLEQRMEQADEAFYGVKLAELLACPDEVWQDQDAQHGTHCRYLRFYKDHVLIALVAQLDLHHRYLIEWCALEYDVSPILRPGGRQIQQLRQGVLVHDRSAHSHLQE